MVSAGYSIKQRKNKDWNKLLTWSKKQIMENRMRSSIRNIQQLLSFVSLYMIQQVLLDVFIYYESAASHQNKWHRFLQSVYCDERLSNTNFWYQTYVSYISGFRPCWKKILCLCDIKICRFSCCTISCSLLAFLTLKKILDFGRNFIKRSFASPDLSTWRFPMNQIKCV